MTTHKMTSTSEYLAWKRMKKSCLNKNYPTYKIYGAVGITIQEEWEKNFTVFFEDMGKMPETCNGLELIDRTKEFCKSNCRWHYSKGGRKPKEKKSVKVKRKASGIKNPKSICLVLESDHLDFIRNLAMQKSEQEGIHVETNQMIREALQKSFPYLEKKS